MNAMKVFALNATGSFGGQVAEALGIKLATHEERDFEDGEHKARPLVSVRGQDVYVLQSLHGGPEQSANDKLCRLLFFAGALRESGAARITALVPYLAYARKDRQTKARDPVTSKYMALVLESVGIDRIVTLEVHNIVAYQNAFRIQALHLDTRSLFAAHVQDTLGQASIVVASPDPGGVKRAQLFREALEKRLRRDIGSAYLEKRRSAGVVSGTHLAGEVSGATVLILDDLISTGGTMIRAAEICLEHGAASVVAYAAHGLFVGDASAAMLSPSLGRVVITDTVPPFRLDAAARERVEVLSAAPLFAKAISRLHDDSSMAELMEG